VLWPALALAQDIQYTDNSPDKTLRSSLTVDPATRALSITIPLGAYPGRAGMHLPVSISYTSKVWGVEFDGDAEDQNHRPIWMYVAKYSEGLAAGWSSSLDRPKIEYGFEEGYDGFNAQPGGAQVNIKVVPRIYVTMPGGARHELRKGDLPIVYDAAFLLSGSYHAVGESLMRFDFGSMTLFMPDGSRYVFESVPGEGLRANRHIDRHGNAITYDPLTKRWADTLGRTFGLPIPNQPGVSPTVGDTSYALPGVGGGTMTYTLRWRRLRDPQTGASVLTDPTQELRFPGDWNCGSIPLQATSPSLFTSTVNGTKALCTWGSERFNPVVLAEVVLPNDTSYKFTYNVWGEIDKVVYPTGGYERYTYTKVRPMTFMKAPYTEANRGVSQRRVSHDGTAASEAVWTYGTEYAGGSGPYVAVVTTPDGTVTKQSIHAHPQNYGHDSRSAPFGFEDVRVGQAYETRVYAPASEGGAMLRRTLTQWAANSTTVTIPSGGTVEATSLPKVIKRVEIILDGGGANALSATTVNRYEQPNRPLNLTSVTQYDYDTSLDKTSAQTLPVTSFSPPDSLALRTTETEYLDDPAYAARNLTALPMLVTVRSGMSVTGVVFARSGMSYDEAAFAPLPCGAAVGWADPGAAARGNVTTTRKWLDTTNTWIEMHAQFDACGNQRKAWGARDTTLANPAEIFYDDAFADGQGRGTFAYATRMLSPIPDPDGSHGSAVRLESGTRFDFQTGRVTSSTDANGQTTSFEYDDPLGRPKAIIRPAGAGRTDFEYGDTAGNLYVRTLTDLDEERRLQSEQYFDGLGRPFRTLTYEGHEAARLWVAADSVYDALGRVVKASSPYRSAGGGVPLNEEEWADTKRTETIYDALGRPTTVRTMPDAATVTTSHDGRFVTVTDQAGKVRRNQTDALGRLIRVDEPDASGDMGPTTTPKLPTHYTYDVLGNLRKVDQGGQFRYFMYDSLSRLIRSRNPEQGTHSRLTYTNTRNDTLTGNTLWSLQYVYDANGNLTSRIDSRNAETTYGFDALDRNVTTSYAVVEPAAHIAATPTVTRRYDGATLGKGRLWRSESSQNSRTTVEQYDSAGQPVRQSQQFWTGSAWGAAFTTSREYDLAGNVISQTYPSGRAVSYAYSAAGRLSDFTGNLGDSAPRAYSTGINYDELGGLRQERFGTQTPVYSKRRYNERGQLSEVRVGTTPNDDGWNRGAILNAYSLQPGTWTQSRHDNNGNLRKQVVYVPHDDAVSGWWETAFYYEYDSLNRLDVVREAQDNQNLWVQDYDYDRWGNRTVNPDGTWVGGPDAEPNQSVPELVFEKGDLQHSNRLYAPGDMAPGKTDAQRLMRYDGAGNLTRDLCHDGTTPCGRVYDSENRMTSAQFLNGQVQAVRYTYDADGRRVTRRGGWEGQVRQVYGFDGELLAEYTPQASASAPRKEYGYRAGELLVTADSPDAAGRANFALAAAGATASASSKLDDNRAPAGAIDGDRAGHNWGAGGGWHDSTPNSFPDWLAVDFGGPKTVDEIDVFSVQDTYSSPQEPSEAAAFTQYGLVDFDVQRWDGSNWVTVPGGAVRGNNLVWRRLKFAPVTTQKIRLLVHAGQASHSRVAELEAWGPAGAPPPRVNVAAASAGATAAASTRLDEGRAASGAINGDRAGRNWGNGGGWHDSSPDAFPDWLEVSFAGSRTVDEVSVFSVQNNFLSPAEPTEQMTFSQYGVTAFEVQWWDGSAWQTAAGVAGNNLVLRKVSFTPVTTTKIRVLVTGALASYSRIAEVEAYGGAAAADVRWLVSDQLGTPRMVFDRTGSLSGVARHDYLPFGEEIAAGGRTTVRGYGAPDGVRQHFAASERDTETGLDYMQARYYGSTMGRFISVDPVALTVERLYDPQQINLYAYCRNNPLAFIDPTGEVIDFANDDARKRFEEYEKFLQSNKNKKGFASLIATVQQLRNSDVTYRIGLGRANTFSGGTEGELSSDGKVITVTLSNVGGTNGERYSLNSRFAHELEHARQFDSGEFAYAFDATTGAKLPGSVAGDISSEVKAWQAQLVASSPTDFQVMGGAREPEFQFRILAEFGRAKTDDERAGILARISGTYKSSYERTTREGSYGRNFTLQGVAPGTLVRPSDRTFPQTGGGNVRLFGRTYKP
jgi:RHS repeat-associated protein